ncbi:phosphate-binding protein [archaeon SCG-AAA382B04]|nr:phosphate-binding protein [archaeon SCG-AAA382B04]
MKKKILATLILVSILAITLSGCLGGNNQKTITVKGSTTVLPIASSCAEEFNQQQKNLSVSVTGGGSSVGIKSVATKAADIGMASRQVTQEEIDEYGDNFNDHIVAYDGIAVIVSENIYQVGVTDLTLQEVKKIYTGEISNWQELGGADQEIFVVTREEGSGTRAVFYETLGIDSSNADQASSGNARVRQAVQGSDSGIGFIGLGYLGEGVKAISLNGVSPTEKNVKSGEYPIKRSLHLYTWGETSITEQTFLDFVLSDEGQQIVEENGFIPAN